MRFLDMCPGASEVGCGGWRGRAAAEPGFYAEAGGISGASRVRGARGGRSRRGGGPAQRFASMSPRSSLPQKLQPFPFKGSRMDSTAYTPVTPLTNAQRDKLLQDLDRDGYFE